MKTVQDLNGEQFQELMAIIHDNYSKLHYTIFNRFFDEFKHYKNPIITSWENDYDEV